MVDIQTIITGFPIIVGKCKISTSGFSILNNLNYQLTDWRECQWYVLLIKTVNKLYKLILVYVLSWLYIVLYQDWS